MAEDTKWLNFFVTQIAISMGLPSNGSYEYKDGHLLQLDEKGGPGSTHLVHNQHLAAAVQALMMAKLDADD